MKLKLLQKRKVLLGFGKKQKLWLMSLPNLPEITYFPTASKSLAIAAKNSHQSNELLLFCAPISGLMVHLEHPELILHPFDSDFWQPFFPRRDQCLYQYFLRNTSKILWISLEEFLPRPWFVDFLGFVSLVFWKNS